MGVFIGVSGFKGILIRGKFLVFKEVVCVILLVLVLFFW